ncbi:YybS family protein [Bacillus manliponensis]|uniref:YybS family protein n=1 Tax=Bacillus manliponensis TaxID=574376 RepID=UPI003512C725
MRGTKFITEGAILLALYIVFLLAFLYMPLLGGIIIFALPLPFIVYTVRNSFRHACLLLGIATLLTLIVSTPFQIFNTVLAGVTGIGLGYMYQKKKNAIEILLVGTLIYIVKFVLLYVISIKFLGIDILTVVQNFFGALVQQAEKMAEMNQMSEERFENLKSTIDLLDILLPTMFVMIALFYSWMTMLLSNYILKRLNYPVQSFGKFRDIKMPKSIIWYYVALIVLSLFVKVEAGTYSYMAFSNLSIAFNFLLLFQGFSFIAFFTHQKGYPKMIPILLFVMGLFIPQLFPLVTILGIIDLGFSLRSIVQSK